MHASHSRRVAIVAAAVLALVAGAGQMPALADATSDPGVARVSVLRGPVDVKRADSGDTLAATVNAPVSAGDYITTGDDAHAEIQFPFGAALRVASGTQLRFTRMDRDEHVAQLAAGTVELRLLRGIQSHPEVATPAATVRPTENGSYRITVTNDGNSAITVRSGRADVITQSGTRSLTSGTTLAVTGTGDGTQMQASAEIAYDDFDRWNGERDSYSERTRDFGYVDQGMVGADDLDRYGHWQDSSYGRAWRPDVDPGWAPYNAGRWTWQPYYGWTWIAAEPWGWAPYHYGRWFYASNGWCWSPGVIAAWPVLYTAPVVFGSPVAYQPALVAFFSFGGGFGGNLGWVPLAPYETFSPWWGSRRTYRTTINNVTNVTNVTNITNVTNTTNLGASYRNATAPGGAVGVTSNRFAAGQFEHVVALRPGDLGKVNPIHGMLPLVPTSKNLAYASHSPSTAAHDFDRRFAPFAAPHIVTRPFSEQQAAIKELTLKAYPRSVPAVARPQAQPAALTRPVTIERIEGSTLEKVSPWSRFDRSSVGAPSRVAGGTSRALPPQPSHALRPANGASLPKASVPATNWDPFSRFDDAAYAGGARAGTHRSELPSGSAMHGTVLRPQYEMRPNEVPRHEPLGRSEGAHVTEPSHTGPSHAEPPPLRSIHVAPIGRVAPSSVAPLRSVQPMLPIRPVR